MVKTTVKTAKAPQAIGPYSQGTRAANLIFTSGQLPLNPATGELVGEIKAATKQSLENVKSILEAAGAKMSDIMKVTVFLRDMNDFAAMNEVYAQFFPEESPARSAVQVARLPKDAIIEIEAVAIVSDHLSE